MFSFTGKQIKLNFKDIMQKFKDILLLFLLIWTCTLTINICVEYEINIAIKDFIR